MHALRLTNTSDRPIDFLIVDPTQPPSAAMKPGTMHPGKCGYLLTLTFHDNGTAVGKGALTPPGAKSPPTIVLQDSDMPAFTADVVNMDNPLEVANCRPTEKN